jgi:hypothetical protein
VRDSVRTQLEERLRREHGAIAAWDEDEASGPDRLGGIWTVQLQQRWMNAPIVLSADLLDIAQDSVGHIATFLGYMGGYSNDVYLILRIDASILPELMEFASTWRPEFVIVADIDRVRRPTLSVFPFARGTMIEDPEIELEPDSPSFLFAGGTLIAAASVDASLSGAGNGT